MGTISSKEIEKIEDIAMQVEELSAMAGGMLYKDILNEISECLLIDFKPNIIKRLENLKDRYSKEEFSYRGIVEKSNRYCRWCKKLLRNLSLLVNEKERNIMTVSDILTITGGNTRFYIQGTTEKDEIVQLAYGKVDDIKFPLVPYGKYGVQHISIDENYLYICIDDNINFAQINSELTDITCDGFTGYII